MIEYTSKQAVSDALDAMRSTWNTHFNNVLDLVDLRVATLPNADVERVVRCKDCEFKDEINCPMYYMGKNLNPDDYCSYGERKE